MKAEKEGINTVQIIVIKVMRRIIIINMKMNNKVEIEIILMKWMRNQKKEKVLLLTQK